MMKRKESRSSRGTKRSKKLENASDREGTLGDEAQSDASEALCNEMKSIPSWGNDLSGWRVATTGIFMLRSRSEVESALKQCGAVVTNSISKSSTHLILGSRTGMNDFNKVTGMRSTNHTKAIDQGLPVVEENDLWNMILVGDATIPKPAFEQDSEVLASSTEGLDVDAKIDVKEQVEPTVVVTGWRVVLTGVFVSRARSEIERMLRKNNTVSYSVTARTTHLIVGGKTTTNYNGVVRGVGSFKYKEASEMGIPIISERKLLRMLGEGADVSDAAPGSAAGSIDLYSSGSANNATTQEESMKEKKEKGFNGAGWRLLLVGEFGIYTREELECELVRHGATVLKSATGCTTHIVLGSKTPTSEYADGSTEYEAAVGNGTLIIGEKDLLAKLTPSSGVQVADLKIRNVKASVQKTQVKSETASSSASLQEAKPATSSEVAKENAEDMKVATSTTKDVKHEDDVPTAVVELPVVSEFIPEPKPQLDARWVKLQAKTRNNKRATGKAKCRGCRKIIEKGGFQEQYQDSSLLFSVTGTLSANMPYIEDGGKYSSTGRNSIGVNTFWVHPECVELVTEKCKLQLAEDIDEINEFRRSML